MKLTVRNAEGAGGTSVCVWSAGLHGAGERAALLGPPDGLPSSQHAGLGPSAAVSGTGSLSATDPEFTCQNYSLLGTGTN